MEFGFNSQLFGVQSRMPKSIDKQIKWKKKALRTSSIAIYLTDCLISALLSSVPILPDSCWTTILLGENVMVIVFFCLYFIKKQMYIQYSSTLNQNISENTNNTSASSYFPLNNNNRIIKPESEISSHTTQLSVLSGLFYNSDIFTCCSLYVVKL